MRDNFDVIVIGAGNAGISASLTAKKAGLSVAIIEKGEIGGTCPLRGCVPKKVLVAATQTIDEINRASAHCIKVGKPKIDWPQLIKRKEKIISPLSSASEKSLKSHDIELIKGQAHFIDGHTVAVNNSFYKAKNIVIATGASPRSLPIPGFNHVISSDDILELEKLPKFLVFIGAGVIGFEFAHVFARMGVKVTLLEVSDHVLPQGDAEIVEKLIFESQRLGITILTKVQVRSIEKENAGFKVHFLHDKKEKKIKTHLVANGAGRTPNIHKLNLEAAGITYEKDHILLDHFLRSRSNPNIFVAGDPASSPQLSPIASYEGKIVGHNLTDKKMISPDYSCIPNCIFTIPTLASVGLTEKIAIQKKVEFTSHMNDLTLWLSSRTYAEPIAYSKILVEKNTDKIIGAHILGHDGEETINLVALAMKQGVTSKQIKEMVFAYPTFTADLLSMM